MKFRAVIYCALLCIPAFGISSCTDELLDVDGEIGEGESRVNATVEFKPLTPALNGKTRAAGDAIKSIENLCVLLYDAEGNLVKKYSSDGSTGDFTFTTKDESRPESTTETATPRATFNLKIPYGRHYIYAVANMGDLDSHAEAIKTVDGLKNISLTWNPNDAALNNQMFGHFTEPDYPNDEAPLLTVNRKDLALHARIRRAASKVTVAFDGSGLEEGVFVYLHSVQIRDIPASCPLGNTNTVTDAENGLIAEGETIDYVPESPESVEDQSVRVTKGRPYYPYDEADPSKPSRNTHSETAPALFFYENMQGKGEDKRQKDEDGDGMPDNADRVKDGKPCGTYIEVKGYYQSINPERLGNGPITYRFMLGKNVTDDYNAERNHHYKLTLKFKRFANDADWHIEYTEQDPDLIVPQYYFVSYLYNHEARLPVKINAEGHKLVGLKAVIDLNSWAPFEAYKTSLDYRKEMDPDNPANADKNINYPWNGFLSLRKTEETDIKGNVTAGTPTVHSANKEYYERSRRGERTYFENGDEFENTNDYGMFTCEQKDGTYVLNLPLYTRAKKLVPATGYTGNNPYVAYLRHAVVRFTATLENTETGATVEKESKVHVMQTRRVVNPKGIWRKHDSQKPFHVVLKTMPYERSETFQTFVSEGKWRAYVARGDKNLVSLNGGDRVEGSTGTPVDFTVGFKETCGENESRCAIIRVEYHDYACVHLIFVRQGKAPMALVSGGAKWRACNMRTKTREASCPVEEGSLFKFGNWNDPIDATNNENPKDHSPWVNVQPEWFADDKDKDFLIAGTNTTKKWDEIKANAGGFENVVLEDGTEVSVARYEDYNALMTADIEFGYGVMYGDDAGETLDRIEEVYGHRYDRHGETGAAGAGYGMRGVFVYNKSDDATYGGRNLFFPVGVSGYGSRQRKNTTIGELRTAVLRYGSKPGYSDSQFPIEVQRPLLFDLFRNPGALYWFRNNTGSKIAQDMNYFSFGFEALDSYAAYGGSDYNAYFVRCVERE